MGEIEANLKYLTRDNLYETEKPYSAEFEVEEADGIQRTNYICSEQRVSVHAIHDANHFDLNVNGFCVINAKTTLNVHDALTQPETVESAYFDELSALLLERFPEYSRLEPIDFVVRKRHERFPADELVKVSHQQPATLAHSDYSIDGAMMQLSATFPGQEEYFCARDFDMINVWRPLLGPNDDWPLALCDYTSIHPDQDIVLADLLYVNRVGENQLLHYDKRHRWYYIEGQQPDDVFIFRNVDSTGKRAKAFHCAFYNPQSQTGPRHSCEARFVAFR